MGSVRLGGSAGPREALVVDAAGVGVLLRRSESSVWRDDKAGRIPAPVRIGGAKRWRVAEIKAWVAAGCPHRSAWKARHHADRGNGARDNGDGGDSSRGI